MVKPIWDKISQENLIPDVEQYIEFIIDKNNNAMKYVQQFGVKQVPTFVITDTDDKVLEMFSGMISETNLINKIKKYVFKTN